MLFALAVPVVGANADTVGCDVRTSPSYSAGAGIYWAGAYVGASYTYVELWMEDNGISGLQKGETLCRDGRVIPSDLCLSSAGSVQSCLVTSALRKADVLL